MIHVGFTGNRGGMTLLQRAIVTELVSLAVSAYRHVVAHHGVCVGSDEQFHEIVRSFGVLIVGHPGMSQQGRQHYLSKTSLLTCHEVRPNKFFLDRNDDIVRESGVVIATPSQVEEQFHGSGTWHTIRLARKQRRPLYLVFPDGVVQRENAEGVL